MLMTLSGIVFGVGFFVLTQAQTSGFEKFFIQTILGVNGAIRVQDRIQDTMRSMDAMLKPGEATGFQVVTEGKKYIAGVEHPREVTAAVQKFSEVRAVSEVLRGSALLRGNFREIFCKPYGVNLDAHLNASSLGSQVIIGEIEDFRESPYGLLIGNRLATKMSLEPGDPITLESSGQTERFRISAIYETGIDQIDKERVFIHLPVARSLFKKPFGSSFLQVSVNDPHNAPELSWHMMSVIGHHVASWQERERSWLEVFKVLKISSGITVSIIIFISGLGMFSTLAITVMEKTRDIAILRSMGYTRSDISQIFLLQGVTVVVCGVLLGWAFAVAATILVTKIPIHIRGIFTTDSLIVEWNIMHYVMAAIIASIVVLIASYFPARNAAKVEPADIIRGTGG